MRATQVSVGMICLLLCFALQGSAKSHQKLAVTGKLTRVMAIGGESTGWAIQFESETTIDEKPMHSLEVAGPSEQLQQLENKIVTAKGTLTYKHGVETGDRPVLKISSIKEAASK